MKNGELRQKIRMAQAGAEAFPGIPVVEIAGDSRVLIENHLGILEYGYERVTVKLDYGRLYICGNHLTMAQMTKHQVVIRGIIQSVSIARGDDK